MTDALLPPYSLKQAFAAVLPGAGYRRFRVHFVRNLLTKVPKSAQTLVATLAAPSSPSPIWPPSGHTTSASSSSCSRASYRRRHGSL